MVFSRFFSFSSSLVGALLCLGSGLVAQETVHFDLRSSLDEVEDASITVLLSRETVAQAVESSAQARANLLPSLNLNATQRRSQSASFGANVTRAGVTNRFDAQLAGRVELLDPQNIANFHATKVGIDVAKLDVDATRETVRATVASTYLRHLRNLARLEVIDANIARAEGLLELAVRQRDAGVATQIDVTRAQAQLAVEQQARLQQETELRASELQFKRLLGLDPDQPVELSPFEARLQRPAQFSGTLEETAFEKRADYLGSQRRLEQNELEVRAAKFNRLPSLALTGNYGRASEYALDGNDSATWSGALQLALPVFDGQRTGSLTRLALSRRRAQSLRQRDLELAIGAEVRLAVQNSNSRRAQVDVAQTSLNLANDELRLAQIRFQQGAADNREMIEAQNRLAIASDNLLEANYQYNLSRVELARATGDVRAVLLEQTP